MFRQMFRKAKITYYKIIKYNKEYKTLIKIFDYDNNENNKEIYLDDLTEFCNASKIECPSVAGKYTFSYKGRESCINFSGMKSSPINEEQLDEFKNDFLIKKLGINNPEDFQKFF